MDYAKSVGLEALGRSVSQGLGGGYPVVIIPDSLVPAVSTDTPFAAFGSFSEHAYYGILEGMEVSVYNERWNGVDLAGHSRAFEIQASIGIAFNDGAAFSVLETALSAT
jgi:HK97 family phage major capsid protein